MYTHIILLSTVQANHEPQVDVHLSMLYEEQSPNKFKAYIDVVWIRKLYILGYT
jgi:hypothetical protein